MNKNLDVVETFSHGVKLSVLRDKLNTVDIIPLIGKFQQLGFLKIVYDPLVDVEPLLQLTEKGKQQAIELLNSIQQIE